MDNHWWWRPFFCRKGPNQDYHDLANSVCRVQFRRVLAFTSATSQTEITKYREKVSVAGCDLASLFNC